MQFKIKKWNFYLSQFDHKVIQQFLDLTIQILQKFKFLEF